METLFVFKNFSSRKFGFLLNTVFATALFSFVFFVPSGFANEGQLVLEKLVTDLHIAEGDSACDEMVYLDSGKDLKSMHGYRCFYPTGKYTMRLSGPAGTLVTIFGKNSFSKERGYLVIRKKDDRMVWILDLEDFPHRKWFNSVATDDSGAFDAFYSAAPIFEQNVSSVKWDNWWEGQEPAE